MVAVLSIVAVLSESASGIGHEELSHNRRASADAKRMQSRENFRRDF
jgi:hypothetical protein